MNSIGANIRLLSTLEDVILQAQRLELTSVQSFVTHHETGNYISLSAAACKRFLACKKNINLIIHGSYKINAASSLHTHKTTYFLKKELALAQRIQAQYVVIHPGSRDVNETSMQAVDTIAKSINTIYAKGDFPILLLENVAFGNRSIGGSLEELSLIKAKLDKPEKVQFCLDTAHAFSFGYNIANITEQELFIKSLDTTLGIDSIALLHINDTQEQLGSQKDRHEIPGNGLIGQKALAHFISHERLKHIPCIVELPCLDEMMVKNIVTTVNNWRL